MIFLNSFLGADELSLAPFPTDFGNATNVQIQNGYFDDLYASYDTTINVYKDIPTVWDFDTVLHAKYDVNINGGNVDFTFDTVTQIVIKRRQQENSKWITLYVQDLDPTAEENINDQLQIAGQDVTAKNANYIYAAVPLLNGIEGNYSIARTIDPDDTSIIYDYTPVSIKELLLVDSEAIYHTPIINGSVDITTNTATTFITTLNEKYPTVVRNGLYYYDTINVTGIFLPTVEDNCELLFTDPIQMTIYNKAFRDWLHNNHPKLLKDENGNIWLVYIESGVSDSAYESNMSELREISFTCDEIGDCEDEEVLWNAGLIDESVTAEYWNDQGVVI